MMSTEASMPPSKTFDENYPDLAETLRDAFKAWLYRDASEDEEVLIGSEVLLKGIFVFAAPTIVNTLNLGERGAEIVTRQFAQALSAAIQERRHLKGRKR